MTRVVAQARAQRGRAELPAGSYEAVLGAEAMGELLGFLPALAADGIGITGRAGQAAASALVDVADDGGADVGLPIGFDIEGEQLPEPEAANIVMAAGGAAEASPRRPTTDGCGNHTVRAVWLPQPCPGTPCGITDDTHAPGLRLCDSERQAWGEGDIPMLFKHKHLLEELRSNGRHGTAEILSIKTVGEGSSMRAMWAPDNDLSSGWMDCWMRLRVVPDEHGQPPFEATVTTRIHTLKFQGSAVPVWYDPRDTSKVAVDYEADLASHDHWAGVSDRLTHRHDQRLGLAWAPVHGELLPLEVLARQGKGRISVKGPIEKLFGQHAMAAVDYIRSHAAEYAPDLDPGWFTRNDLHVDEPYGGLPPGLTVGEAASGGLAFAAAFASLISGHPVRVDVALTGAVAPDGTLLPVDDLKGKAHAAKEGDTQLLIAPKANEHDLYQVSNRDRGSLQLVFAATVAEALHTALTRKAQKDHHPRLP